MVAKKIIGLVFFSLVQMVAMAQESVLPASHYTTQDSVVTYASSLYQPNSFLRRILMGNNYRKEWKEYVKLPVFHFSQSGFRIEELGGGMQTKSLQLQDSLGREWALRTVDKDASKALPPGVRRTLARRVSQDFISSSFPYSAPVAGALVNAAGIAAPRPEVFFVADDPALGEYRSIFANTICTLEEREPGYADTDDTEKAADNLKKSNRYKIQQPVLLKARLMDMLMSDWDRHADNWRWGQKDSAGLEYYYAVPRDRDWVFYQSKGFLPLLARLSKGMRFLINFSPKVKNIKNLSWKAWTLDKNFLNEMDAADWETAIRDLQASLTDSVIAAAAEKLPASVYEMDGKEFINTLKSRRDDLREGVMKYYRFLAEDVLINGSDENEISSVSASHDSLRVTVSRMDTRQKIYERTFSPDETYFITLNGLAGNDLFEVAENVSSKIRLTIKGGEGIDRYDIKGDIRTKIYDTVMENNDILNKGHAKVFLN